MKSKPLKIFTTLIQLTVIVIALWFVLSTKFFTPKYDVGGLFCCGLVPVEDKNYKWGYIDKHGKKLIKCQYDTVWDFDKYGRAIVRKGDKYYLIDTHGNAIGDSPYTHISESNLGNNTYIVGCKNGDAIIDSNGKYIFRSKNMRINYFYKGLATVRIDGKYGYMNEDFKIVIPCKFDFVTNFEIPEYATARYLDQWGVIDAKGYWVILPEYDFISDVVSTEWIGVEKNGYRYYRDFDGNVISDKYLSEYDFYHNRPSSTYEDSDEDLYDEYLKSHFKYPYLLDYTFEESDSYCKVYDGNGNIVFTIKADYISPFYPDGYAIFEKDDKFGIIDRFGNVVVPAKYEGISDYNYDGV